MWLLWVYKVFIYKNKYAVSHGGGFLQFFLFSTREKSTEGQLKNKFFNIALQGQQKKKTNK